MAFAALKVCSFAAFVLQLQSLLLCILCQFVLVSDVAGRQAQSKPAHNHTLIVRHLEPFFSSIEAAAEALKTFRSYRICLKALGDGPGAVEL